MKNTKGLLVFCGIISALIFAYYFSPANLAWGGGDVTVSATIASTLSCDVSTTTTDFGALTTGAVSTSTPNVTVTMSSNSAGGATLSINDAGNASNPGLYSATTTSLIASADATLVAGVEGYGVQATSTGLTINPVYNKTGLNVGGLTIAATALSSSTGPITGQTTVITHKAAISNVTKAATDYADTITYSCLGN